MLLVLFKSLEKGKIDVERGDRGGDVELIVARTEAAVVTHPIVINTSVAAVLACGGEVGGGVDPREMFAGRRD